MKRITLLLMLQSFSLLLPACKDGGTGKKTPDETEDSGKTEEEEPLPSTEPTDYPPGVNFLDPRNGDVFTVDMDIHGDVLAGDEADFTTLVLTWDGNVPDLTGLPSSPSTDGTIDFLLDPLPLGDYSLSVTAADAAGQKSTATVEFSVVAPDADGDGFINYRLRGDDCDDSRADIYPGAEEVCDEHDNDCDGRIDEDVTTSYWKDLDADGYGDPLARREACAPPPVCVDNDDDCDDTQGTMFPGNPESCDYLDNDCNGTVDEGVTIPYYRDVDADGYGDAADVTQDCSLPSGYSAVDTDCDDVDAAISPAASEICMDDLDNNCDGTSVPCGLSGIVDLDNADARFFGATASDFSGTSVSGGDFNKDGFADVVIGAFGNDDGGAEAGAVYVMYGPLAGDYSLATPDLVLVGEEAGDNAGYTVSTAGDYNGDGRDDILVGSWANDTTAADAGAVYLVHGGDAGTLDLSVADGIFWGEAAGDQAGFSASSAGDTDGDGYGDILIGGWGADGGGSLSGGAWLVRGPYVGNLTLGAADAEITGATAGDLAGYSVSTAGDTDGDGYDDVIIGGYGANAAAGKAWLLRGPLSSMSLSSATAVFTGEVAGDNAGASVSTAGDTDGDGNADVIIGAYLHDYGGTNTGAAYVVFGPMSGTIALSTADSKVTGEDSDDNAGWSVASAGDMDGDGQDDLLIGAFREDAGGNGAGAAYLVYGPPTAALSLRSADAKMVGTEANGYAANSVAVVGDTDGDGKADIIVGGPYSDNGGPYLGGISWLVQGTGL